jgi:hypothetical protein
MDRSFVLDNAGFSQTIFGIFDEGVGANIAVFLYNIVEVVRAELFSGCVAFPSDWLLISKTLVVHEHLNLFSCYSVAATFRKNALVLIVAKLQEFFALGVIRLFGVVAGRLADDAASGLMNLPSEHKGRGSKTVRGASTIVGGTVGRESAEGALKQSCSKEMSNSTGNLSTCT